MWNGKARQKNANVVRASAAAVESLEERVLLFKPYTHVTFANEALADANDGQVLINGKQYSINTKVKEALAAYPQFYRAGALGPDAW